MGGEEPVVARALDGRRLPDRDDRPGRHGARRQRLDDHPRPYAKNIRKAVDYLLGKSRRTASSAIRSRTTAIPTATASRCSSSRKCWARRKTKSAAHELVEKLEKACDFSGKAQTPSGGWGYVSAKDGNNFDEGSTTITQVQGLRGCRNAGIVVPAEVIDRAKEYIYDCKNPDGGISYSSRNRGSSRPAITAAALATLYNAGVYDSKHVPEMLEFCKKNLQNLSEGPNSFGHWHYTYLYYSQVMYRQGKKNGSRFAKSSTGTSSESSSRMARGPAISAQSMSPPAT